MPDLLHNTQPLELKNARAAQILANPDIAVYLKPFMYQALSIKQAAEMLHLPIQTMHYRVKQMEKAGLLKVVSTKARRGRPIKHYQAKATTFKIATKRIPPTILQALDHHQSWKRQLERGLEQAFGLPKYQEHVIVYLDQDGLLIWDSELQTTKNPEFLDKDFPAVFNMWNGGLRLNRKEAKQLQLELWELYERYAHRGGDGKYVMHLGLAPAFE
jgi:DNA-binding Lrp family transcriptional regulator